MSTEESEFARLRAIANEGPTDDELANWKRAAAGRGDGTVLFLATILQNVRLAAAPVPEDPAPKNANEGH